jgi:hypothetical protein
MKAKDVSMLKVQYLLNIWCHESNRQIVPRVIPEEDTKPAEHVNGHHIANGNLVKRKALKNVESSLRLLHTDIANITS